MWYVLAAMVAIQLIKGVMGANAQNQQAKAQYKIAKQQAALQNAQAQQLEINAGQERAAGQRASLAAAEQGGQAVAHARNLAAASGTALDSPDIVNIMGDLQGKSDYNAGMQTYNAEQRAHDLEYNAAQLRAGAQLGLESGRAMRDSKETSGLNYLLAGFGGAAGTAMQGYGMTQGASATGGQGGTSGNPQLASYGGGYQTSGYQSQPLMGSGNNQLYANYGRGGFNSYYG